MARDGNLAGLQLLLREEERMPPHIRQPWRGKGVGKYWAHSGKKRNPILIAAKNVHKDIVSALLDTGAEPNYDEINGISALVLASFGRDQDHAQSSQAGNSCYS